MTLHAHLLIACLALHGAAAGDEFRGAAAVLRDARSEQPAVEPGDVSPDPGNPIETFTERVRAFGELTARLEPAEAAAGWLELLDAYDALIDDPTAGVTPQEGGYGYGPGFGLGLVITALPPPDAWPALSELIRRRPVGEGSSAARRWCLRLLAAMLVDDEPARRAELEGLHEFMGTVRDVDRLEELALALRELSEALREGPNDPQAAQKVFARRLDEIETQGERRARATIEDLAIPDLVALVGDDEAERLLMRSLRLPVLIRPTGKETLELARRLALQHVDEMVVGQWGLCLSMETAALTEALDARFGAPRATPDLEFDRALHRARQEARWHALMQLIATGREDDARAMVAKITAPERYLYHQAPWWARDNRTAARAMSRTTHATRAIDFLEEMLAEDPERPLWGAFIELSRAGGRLSEALEAIRPAVDAEPTTDVGRWLAVTFERLLLALGRQDEVMARHRRFMSRSPAQGVSPTWNALDLARLGLALRRRALVDESVERLRELRDGGERTAQQMIEIADFYDRLGDAPAAEALLTETILTHLRDREPTGWWGESTTRHALSALAFVYHRAGRGGDVLELADRATWWAVRDLVDVEPADAQAWSPSPIPVAVALADALVEQGRAPEARRILRAMLDRDPTDDDAYDLLVALDGLEAEPYFDLLRRRDALESRPLLATARALLDGDRVEVAAHAIDRAWRLPPISSRSPRASAHEVLAQVRAAQGRPEEAERHRRAVQALRRARDADELCEAGLIAHGIDAYREALAIDGDLYDVHLSVAQRLDEIGRRAEADASYTQGFTRMTGAFGTLAQGLSLHECASLLRLERLQGVAEPIFVAAVETAPADPSLHVLLGLLYEEQGRLPDALERYRRALEIDPEHPLACHQVHELGWSPHVPAAERDRASLRIWRMRPLALQSRSYLGSITDLRRLWETVASIEPLEVVPPSELYEFAAASKKLDALAAQYREAGEPSPEQFAMAGSVGGTRRPWFGRRTPTPAESIAEHAVVRALAAIYDRHW